MELGRLVQRQETPLRPAFRPSGPEGLWRKGDGDYQRLPCEEGGAPDGTCASPASDDARNVVRGDGAC